MHNPLNLTFGIEIECIVVFDPTLYEQALPKSEGKLWSKDISRHLHQESKLRIICRNYIVAFLRSKGFRTYDVDSPGGNQQWTIANDASIQIQDGPRREDGFLECDVEIKSPAFRLCPRALGRVQRVVQLLTKEFDMFVNESCGFHVHIGNRKSGFPLQTLKHFCMLTALFEHQLNSLHPAYRIGNEHARAPSALFKGQNPWDSVETIQNCVSKTALVLLYCNTERSPDRCWAYNLLPLVFGPHKTIEFRQHKGTLDGPEMTNWVQVAAGMVNQSHELSPDGIAQLISDNAFDLKFTITDLLAKLKVEKNVISYYRGEMYPYPRRGTIWIAEKAGPRRNPVFERWDDLERRQRIERLQELVRLEELDRRHEFERQRELEKQEEEVNAGRGAN